MITIKTIGDWKKTRQFFDRMLRQEQYERLDALAREGTAALASATPVDTGKTAGSWEAEVNISNGRATITWSNNNVTRDGQPIAIMLQYGHGTGTGGYVQGRDYINPAIQPVFDNIADAVWKVVTK